MNNPLPIFNGSQSVVPETPAHIDEYGLAMIESLFHQVERAEESAEDMHRYLSREQIKIQQLADLAQLKLYAQAIMQRYGVEP